MSGDTTQGASGLTTPAPVGSPGPSAWPFARPLPAAAREAAQGAFGAAQANLRASAAEHAAAVADQDLRERELALAAQAEAARQRQEGRQRSIHAARAGAAHREAMRIRRARMTQTCLCVVGSGVAAFVACEVMFGRRGRGI